jgi:hypothetical protein
MKIFDNPKVIFLTVFIILIGAVLSSAANNPNRFGGGIHYWRTMDQIKDDTDFDEDGVSWIVSYQYSKNLLKLETDIEIFPNGYYGSDDTAIMPEAFFGIGSAVYVAVGIGTVYADDLDDTFEGPVYILRGGLDLALLPDIYLDLNANYYFSDWDNVDNVDTDTVTFGGQLRFAF